MSRKVQTKEEYFEDIKRGALDYQLYKFENPSIKIDGNKAIIKARVIKTLDKDIFKEE